LDTTATTSNAPPPRPDGSDVFRGPHGRWWPTFAVLGVILVVVTGGYVVAAALSEPVGRPVDVGGVVRLQPLGGWQDTGHLNVGGFPFVRLTRGSGNLDTLVVPGAGGPAVTLATDYVDKVLGSQLRRLSVSDRPEVVTLGSGQEAVRLSYVGLTDTGTSIEGEVTALVTPNGDGVIFDGWAPEGLLTFVDGDIDTMVDEAVIR
jgi:hypothetical protein